MFKHSALFCIFILSNLTLSSMNIPHNYSTIKTNDNYTLSMPTCYLNEFKTVMNHKFSENTSITTPSLSYSDWKVIIPIIEIAYKSTIKNDKNLLDDFFKNYEPLQNKDSLYFLACTFDYLEHTLLYDLCCQKLSQQKDIEKNIEIPLQTQNRIAHYLINETPFLSEIPAWIGKKTALKINKIVDHDDSIWSAQYNSAGTLIAAGDAKGNLHVWNQDTNSEVTFHCTEKPISSVVFDHHNNIWLAAQDGKISHYNRAHNEIDYIKEINGSFPFTLSLHPHNENILAYDSEGNSITIFKKESNVTSLIEGHHRKVQTFTIHPEGNNIISGGSDEQIRIANIETTQTIDAYLDMFSDGIYHVRCIDPHQLAAGTKTGKISLIDTRTKKITGILQGHKNLVWSCLPYKNNFLISGGRDKTVRIWDMRNLQTIREFTPDQGDIHALDIANNMLCGATESGNIHMWQIEPLFGLIQKTENYFNNSLNLKQAALLKKLYTAKALDMACTESPEITETLQQFSTYHETLIRENFSIKPLKKHALNGKENKKNKKKKRK